MSQIRETVTLLLSRLNNSRRWPRRAGLVTFDAIIGMPVQVVPTAAVDHRHMKMPQQLAPNRCDFGSIL
jgi:hypothetical protein